MKCQLCDNPATVHVMRVTGGEKKEMHLCADCAEGQHLTQKQELNLPAIVQSMIGQHLGPEMDELSRLRCPVCGIKYMEFRARGRLGCPHDYTVFRAGLDQLLMRIHRKLRHVGKSPRRGASSCDDLLEASRLRQELSAAVASEQYEEAARLRDLLRRREAADEPR